ncbi:BMP family protein [Anaerolinea sp.]|uniref:BMP family protein n=1 Tax=Anaerolinea sp. TaxID=1872519 RepID=UPI002ACD583E|nr:BMP family protein [Anaerolinea sp.]
MKRVLFVVLLLALVLAACTPATPTQPAKTYKLAAIFPGVINDSDYNTLGYMGAEAVKKDLGIEMAYSETVAVPDIDRVMREYIDQGYNIIWTHGGQYVNQTIELAKQFPDVVFIAEGDAQPAEMPANVWFIDRNFHIGFYGVGALAARITQTGKIGYIGGLTLPFSYAEVHAMQQAIKDSGKNVELKAVWAGDFNDPTKARQVADTMIAEGYDVLVGSLNNGMLGVFEAAKAATDKKILVTAKYTDKTSIAPDNYVTSLLYDFVKPMKEIVGKIQAGEKGGYYPLGFDTGVSLQTPFKNVDPAVEEEMKSVINDLVSGKIQVVKDTSEIK